MTVTRQIPVDNPSGLHARPAALFARTADGFQSTITVRNLSGDTSRRADARSVLSVLTLGVEPGHIIEVTVDGEDEDSAMDTLERLVLSGLGEGADTGGGGEDAPDPGPGDDD
jgi:phosphotransferase system HPr (HPr) family protein